MPRRETIASEMAPIAQRLVAEEFRSTDPVDTKGRAAFRVCEKLRPPLATLAGAAGSRALFLRALVLARRDVSWLDGMEIMPNGAFQFTAEREADLGQEVAVAAGSAFVAQVLGLLVTFIGEALTLRLVQDVWPQLTLKNLDQGDHP